LPASSTVTRRHRVDPGRAGRPSVLIPIHQLGPTGIGNVLRSTLSVLRSHDVGVDVNVCGRPGARDSLVSHLRYEQVAVPYRARRHDLLHMCDYRVPVLASTPFVLTVHDLFFLERPDWYPRRVAQRRRLLLEVSLRKGPAAIVCVSRASAERLRALYPGIEAERVFVVHPPAPVGRGEGWSGAESAYFLSISTFEPRKNLLMLLHAFREAREGGCSLRWLVVGGRRQQGAGIARALERCDGVDLVFGVDDSTLRDLLARAAFLAAPSLGEGFGLPVLEAMAAGTPVVVSSVSAFDEVVGDAGVLVSPVDQAGWARWISELDSSRERLTDLSMRARARARTFSAERTACGYADVYAFVLNRA
jgi:glycosyltransferase involved in cell wall biosynthesis